MAVKKKSKKKIVKKKPSYDVNDFDEAVKEVKDILIKWKNSWQKPREALAELLYMIKEIWGVEVDYDDQDEGGHFI